MTSGRVVRLWCVGDSVTAGGNAAQDGAYRHGLRADLLALGYAFVMVGGVSGNIYGTESPALRHDAHSGFLIEMVLDEIDVYQQAAQPDLCLLEIGTNNFATNWRPDRRQAASGIAYRLIDRILSGVGTPHLVVSAIPPGNHVSNSADMNELIATYNADLAAYVAAKAATGSPIAFVDPALTTADLVDFVHPNAAGYAKMQAAFRAACVDYFEGLD